MDACTTIGLISNSLYPENDSARTPGLHRNPLSIRRTTFARQCTVLTCAGLLFIGLATSVSAQNFANWTPAQTSETPAQQAPAPAAAEPADLTPEEIQSLVQSDLIATQEQAKRLAGGEEGLSTYTLGATDVIEIKVMRHPEVSGEYPINQEGKIQYEFVGDIMISGLTKDQAEDTIRQALTEYIVAPEVTVKIAQYNSKVVYVVGEVYNPGKIFMRGDTITVREALVQAGLPRLTGITKKSHLITPSTIEKPEKRFINVYALIYEGDLRQNETMKPGDVLYIPPTLLTRTMRAISPITAPIGQAAGARTGVDTIGTGNQ